jgi:DNA-binding LytR/AlgR family response regulator
MSGDLFRAYCVIVPLILLATVVNTLSTVYDLQRAGHEVALWKPLSWEVSSAIALMAAALITHIASRLAPPGKAGWTRMLLVNALATLPFSAIHTGGMFGLRSLVYLAEGEHYGFSAWDILYEYRKDLLTYAILYGAFRITMRPKMALPAAKPANETLFDIVDGARLHRVPLGEIVSLRAAGNYVEFVLAGNERPLMRGSLQDMQDRLSPHGFLRTHRSWIVNPARVRQIKAIGSGDFQLTLENGEEAPLSRRFPEALTRLRENSGEI